MPPVFGPVSLLADPLEVLRGREGNRPLAVADREQRDLLALEQLLDQEVAAQLGGRAQAGVELVLGAADEDALACREPVDLDHAGRSRDGESLRRSARRRPPARPSQSPSSPSIRAAASVGPNTATPPRRSVSARPTTSGASGPTTTRSIASSRQSESSPSPSSARTGWHCPSAAMPGLPGAACSSSSCGLAASFQASACSRPPDPTISTFTAPECTAGGRRRPMPCRVRGSPGLLPSERIDAAPCCDGTWRMTSGE